MEPFSTKAHETVLTVNGTEFEDNDTVHVECIAKNFTYLRRDCTTPRVQIIFHQAGRKVKVDFCVNFCVTFCVYVCELYFCTDPLNNYVVGG